MSFSYLFFICGFGFSIAANFVGGFVFLFSLNKHVLVSYVLVHTTDLSYELLRCLILICTVLCTL